MSTLYIGPKRRGETTFERIEVEDRALVNFATGAQLQVAGTDYTENVTATPAVNLIHQATITLTNAQIKTLPTTPVTVAAAPGVGKSVVFLRGTSVLTAVEGAYTNVDAANAWAFQYDGSDASNPYLSSSLAGVDLWGYSPIVYVASGAWLGNVQDVALGDNVALTFYASNGSAGVYTGGHVANTLVISAAYLVLNQSTGAYDPTA